MKRLTCTILAILLIASLCACTGGSGKNGVRVKCPACGYEFDVDTKG